MSPINKVNKDKVDKCNIISNLNKKPIKKSLKMFAIKVFRFANKTIQCILKKYAKLLNL